MGLVGPTPADIADFLRTTARLSPVRVGEYIGDVNHRAILDAYVDTFDFRGLSFPAAMRRLLCVVKMPGEAQIVDRFMEVRKSKGESLGGFVTMSCASATG